MNGLRDYMRNIINAVRSTASGMKVTLRYWLMEPPITIEYPDRLGPGRTKEDIVSSRFRGFLGLRQDRCTGCMRCMKACPVECILIQIEKRGTERFITRFEIDQAQCMYCGLCVEECRTGALSFSRRFEGACYDRGDLRIRHVTEPVRPAQAAVSGSSVGT